VSTAGFQALPGVNNRVGSPAKPQLFWRIYFLNCMNTRIGRYSSTGRAVFLAVAFAAALPAQRADTPADGSGAPAGPTGSDAPRGPVNQRVFGVLPNYRTADATLPFRPLTAKQKMTIAFKDSTDWPVIPVAGAFASLYQLEDQNPSFGQGMAGYGKRFAAAYGDQAIGNFMTEGIMPSLFREDPRYFRRGYGTTKSRLWYAATRIFVCRTDAGHNQFNFAEVVGNSMAAAVSNAYYPDTRTASDNLQRLIIALATDSFSQVGKEFWPDIKRKLFVHHKRD
jgi:hypothetical protein